MSIVDRFLPPPGAPGAVRVGADIWRRSADDLQSLVDGLHRRSAVLTASWDGPARSSFDAQSQEFVGAVESGVALLSEYAKALNHLADGIERAQDEYHQRLGAVVGTAVVGVLLTLATATLSDEAAGGLVAAELATVTEVAATAAEQALAVLATLGAQAAALAARWAVFGGVAVGVDGASGMMVHHDLDLFAHIHWGDDLELSLVGALAVPIGGVLLAGTDGLAGGVLATGAAGVATRLALGGASMATADVVVRAALRQGIDPGELAMAALPFGRAGRGGRPGAVVAPEGTVPLGFADAEEFAAFTRELKQGLADAGYGDAVPVFQGSAVTGVKYTTGEAFDQGRQSDFDIALVDPQLFQRLKGLGLRMRSRPARTPPLNEDALAAVGLLTVRRGLVGRVQRKVAFMVYDDLKSALDRAGGIIIR